MAKQHMDRRGFLGASAGSGMILAGLTGSGLGRAGKDINDTIQVAVLGPGL